MQKGFNSDVSVKGVKHHVQTQDLGRTSGFIMTQVFLNGAIVKTVKTSYQDIFKTGPRSEDEAIRQALQTQHNRTIDSLLRSGV